MELLRIVFEALRDHPLVSVLVPLLIFLISRSFYRIFFHPLSSIPGPLLAKCTSAWVYYHSYIGDECSTNHRLHTIYGHVLRVGPNDVDIADGAAVSTIYVEKGGFRKSPCYVNFDIDGHPSIFSELDPTKRALRAKAVVGLFSTSSLRAGTDIIHGCVDRMVVRLKAEAGSQNPVNVLNLTRSLAIDTVSSYLFRHNYGGLKEVGLPQLSASPFVDAFVAVGRFFYLPNSAFLWLEWLSTRLMPQEHAHNSMTKVDNFVSGLVEGSTADDNYPGRLIENGISMAEAKAQCKDLIFAGTDSTAMNLATICWCLARESSKYESLRKEILDRRPTEPDLQSLPYLRGVIREGLRLSMANPSRLPRVVPSGGWTYNNYHFPAGTNVGVAPYELHLNPRVFRDPEKFLPERWLDPSDEMMRDWIPFGLGSRQCIARNLATVELYVAVQSLVEADVLRGARAVGSWIEIMEWFNSKVKGERIELAWDQPWP